MGEDLKRVASLIDSVVSCVWCQSEYPSVLVCPQVDFEESDTQMRFCVKPNVDPELDKSECLDMPLHRCVGVG